MYQNVQYIIWSNIGVSHFVKCSKYLVNYTVPKIRIYIRVSLPLTVLQPTGYH